MSSVQRVIRFITICRRRSHDPTLYFGRRGRCTAGDGREARERGPPVAASNQRVMFILTFPPKSGKFSFRLVGKHDALCSVKVWTDPADLIKAGLAVPRCTPLPPSLPPHSLPNTFPAPPRPTTLRPEILRASQFGSLSR